VVGPGVSTFRRRPGHLYRLEAGHRGLVVSVPPEDRPWRPPPRLSPAAAWPRCHALWVPGLAGAQARRQGCG